jgi:hypothetical protein
MNLSPEASIKSIFLSDPQNRMPRRSASDTNTFRVNRKAFGLTYSCPRSGDCRHLPAGEHAEGCGCEHPIKTHQELIDFLETKGVNQYIVGKEEHKSGKIHWHAYAAYDHIIDSSDPRVFDCNGAHPNIVPGRPGKGWQAYCVKDKIYESNFYDKNPFKKALLCESADEAINFLWDTRPEDMCKQGDRIAENIRSRMKPAQAQRRFEGPYPEEFYPRGWNPETHSLLLVGPPNLGKTQYARYLLGDCDYIKSNLEELKKCRWDKPLLFDEVMMLEAHPEQSKEITDVVDGGGINLRFKNVQIPPGVRRVFVHNIEHPFRNPSNAVYGRRVHTHVIDGPCAQAALDIASAHAAPSPSLTQPCTHHFGSRPSPPLTQKYHGFQTLTHPQGRSEVVSKTRQLTLNGNRLPSSWIPRSAADGVDDTPFPGKPVRAMSQKSLLSFVTRDSQKGMS